MEEWQESLKKSIEEFSGQQIESLDPLNRDGSPNIIVLGLASSLLLLFLFLLWLILSLFKSSGKKNNGKSLLLIGESGGGKSALFYRLAEPSREDLPQTVTSLAVNEATTEIKWEGKTAHPLVVDIPGHGRVRRSKTLEYGPDCRAIVFVIDSLRFRSDLRPVAESLRDVLVNSHFQKTGVPVLVFCNKMDLRTAVDADEIRGSLEKELDSIFQTQLAVPGGEDDDVTPLVSVGEKFTFDLLENDFSVVSGSVRSNDLDKVYEFIIENFD